MSSLGDSILFNYSQNNNFNSLNIEDELIKCYIGKNNDKLFEKVKNPNSISKNFNIFAFLFGPIYFMYRKMYLIGIIIWLVTTILFSVFPVLVFLIYIINGCIFIKMYNLHINKKINKIRLENNNATFDELKSICLKKGGVNYLVPTVMSVLLAIAVTFSLVILSSKDFWEQLASELSYRSDTNYVDGTWNCKGFSGSGEGDDFIVTMKLDDDMSFSWSKYNDSLNNHVYGTYTYTDLEKTNNSSEYRYFSVDLSSSEYVMDGELQSEAYSSKYEMGISKTNKDAILMNIYTYNMYHCYLED